MVFIYSRYWGAKTLAGSYSTWGYLTTPFKERCQTPFLFLSWAKRLFLCDYIFCVYFFVALYIHTYNGGVIWLLWEVYFDFFAALGLFMPHLVTNFFFLFEHLMYFVCSLLRLCFFKCYYLFACHFPLKFRLDPRAFIFLVHYPSVHSIFVLMTKHRLTCYILWSQ